MKSKLAIITVVYQNYDVLKDFFSSLENQTSKNFHLFICDLSDDKKEIEEKNVNLTVIESQNRGYAHGVNVALKKAIGQGFNYFCVINNDTYFEKEFVQRVLQSLKNHPKSLIGGKIYYARGFEYHKGRYEKTDLGRIIWYAGGGVDWDHAITPHRGVDEVDRGQCDNFSETEFITGALILFDKKVIDNVGFWDESYFLYFEDADFCERAKRKGIKLYYDPSIAIYHKVSQSTEGSGSLLHKKYQSRNRLKFGLKYAPLRTKTHLIINAIISSFWRPR